MKRDMELVRKILLAVEAMEPTPQLRNPVIEGYDPYIVDHHVYLMSEAGLVKAIGTSTQQSGPLPRAAARHLTWEGHEALEVFRNDTVWQQTKTAVEKAGGATIPLWIELAATYAKAQLGLGG